MVAHVFYIHAAVADAVSTAVALVRVHFYADKTEAVEQTVDCPQGADETAEAAIAEHAGKEDDDQDDKFSREKDAQHAEQFIVARVGEQPDRAFQRAGRADILTEARHGHIVLEAVPERDRNHEES